MTSQLTFHWKQPHGHDQHWRDRKCMVGVTWQITHPFGKGWANGLDEDLRKINTIYCIISSVTQCCKLRFLDIPPLSFTCQALSHHKTFAFCLAFSSCAITLIYKLQVPGQRFLSTFTESLQEIINQCWSTKSNFVIVLTHLTHQNKYLTDRNVSISYMRPEANHAEQITTKNIAFTKNTR